MAGLGEICNTASRIAANLVKRVPKRVIDDLGGEGQLYASVRIEVYVRYDGSGFSGDFNMVGSGVARGKFRDVYMLAKEAFDQALRYKRQLSYYSDSYYKIIVTVFNSRFSDETIIR